jgi:hypothetical protein
VDDVQGKENRDARRAFLDGDFLQFVEPFGVVEPQHRACARLTRMVSLRPGPGINSAPLIWASWPIFSSRLIRANSASTRAATSLSFCKVSIVFSDLSQK